MTTIHDDLARFTEYQLATLEGLPAGTSRWQRARHQDIADEMVRACRKYGVDARRALPRLRALLEQEPQHDR